MSDQSNVVHLADRVVGRCVACREPVLFAENFFRVGRAFAHVGCEIRPSSHAQSGDFPKAVPPIDRGA